MVKVICKTCKEMGKENVVHTDGKDEPLMYAPCTRHRRTVSGDKVLTSLRKHGASNTIRISNDIELGIVSTRKILRKLLEKKSIHKLYGYKRGRRFTVYVTVEDLDRYLGKKTTEYGKLTL